MAESIRLPRIEEVRPADLEAHVAFLASDAMAGRDTPSAALDIAAEYAAAQFRRFGVKPGVGTSYFQTAQSGGKPVHNILAVIEGRDPKLKNEVVFLSAHYDGLGMRGESGDRVLNGANDNASGVAAVLEAARVLQKTRSRARRTIVFALWWGEEKGLLGARHYVQNPVFPLKDTVGMLNLEQVGRTDDAEGARVAALAMTGFDFTTLTPTVQAAAQRARVEIQRHPRFSAEFFLRSDNAAFARAGIPAVTLCAAFLFPDYHRPGDEWPKLDYVNMARLTRAIAWSAFAVADAPERPAWQNVPATDTFRSAQAALTGG